MEHKPRRDTHSLVKQGDIVLSSVHLCALSQYSPNKSSEAHFDPCMRQTDQMVDAIKHII